MTIRAWLVFSLLLVNQSRGVSAQIPADTSRTISIELTSIVFANIRTIRVYLPPGYHEAANAERSYPILLMADGFAVFSARSWNAPGVLDSLIHGGFVVPLILVGIDNAASIPGTPNPSQARANEYLPYRDVLEPDLMNPQGHLFPDMLWNEVLPAVEKRFRVDSSPPNVVVGGSSYGAIAALYAATTTGHRFGGLLIESPPVFMFDGKLIADLASAKNVPSRMYIGIGTAETPDTAILRQGALAIRRLVEVAHARSATDFNEVRGATHESKSWRERLPRALQFLFPKRG